MSRGGLVVAVVAAVLSLATLGVFLAVAGDADLGPWVYKLQPGERRYFPPGATITGIASRVGGRSIRCGRRRLAMSGRRA